MQSKIIDREVRAGTAERNNRIRRIVKSPSNPLGRTKASLAREYKITEARVNQIVKRKDSEPEEKTGFFRRILKRFTRR